MRYEDASHTGAFQGSGPIANDDLELIAAGSKSSATGNLITGEGTQSGSAGADSAAGAHVTAIAGKSGEDSSFSGGKLSVAGDYGKLSVDADGNYVYEANKGVENVRDRFTYTLADNQGASDTASLIVEIGKTPVVIKANAQQIVPGPDGVVTLPPGVELSDVHVVGRNLVIDLPDGTQLVIIDGAVFVPQLVIDGVSVPATNVAALLVGQEIQPAAGETPPSGGGNFALPPPPLDPGVPLGDLIPPTEYVYTPPEPQQPLMPLDEEPEAGSAEAFLDDDAQAGGIAGGVGDDPGSDFASGDLPGSGGDGDLTWALLPSGALPAGFSFAPQLNGDMWVMQGGTHVLTITVNPDNGNYTVTQVAAIDHPAGGDENNLDFIVDYSVTDEDGDVATGTLTIHVDDDTPTIDVTVASDANVVLLTQDAETDGDPTNTDTDSTSANFGGIFGATSAYGADGAGTTSLTYALSTTGGASGLNSHGVAINLYSIGGVIVGSTAANAGAVNAGNTIFDISVDANTGVVTVNQYAQIDHTNTDPSPTGPGYEDHLISLADGAVTLTRNGSITDGDGDTITDSASVGIGANIKFADDGPTIDPTLNRVEPAVVDESAPVDTATIPLVGGYTAGDDPHMSGGLAIGKGSTSGPVIDANAAFGADGPAAGGGISYSLDVLNAVSGLTTTEGVAINLVELANGVVVGVVDGTQTVAFAITIDSGTGVVTVEQYLSLFHPDSPTEYDEPVFLNEGSLGVRVTASDFDGDSVTSDAVDITSLIRFEDDGPTIDPALNADATVTVDESLPSNTPGINTGAIAKGDDPDLAGGFALGQGNSGVAVVNANAAFGADGPAAEGSIVYALSITNPDPGVTLTDGTTITMQLVNGVIVGVVDSGPFDGQAAFAIAINPATGVVTVEQYLSLDHPDVLDPNDPLGLGDNTVAVNVTATDGDGDQIESDDIDISGQITFLDDGPTVTPSLGTDAAAAVDESPPVAAAAIDTGPYAKGDDPDLVGGLAIGTGSTTLLDATAVFGADGPGAEGGLTFALAIINPSSGLTLTDGSAINLVLLPSGVVVGVVSGGAFDGQAAFAIEIDPANGVANVELYLSLDHPVNPNPNDVLTLAPGSLGATVTATDGDGDTATSSVIDVSGRINFLDDGPTVDPTLDREATVTVDESLPSDTPAINTGAIVKGNDPDLAGGLALGQANSGGAIVDANAVFGADGPAAGGGISYALVLGVNDTSLTLTDGSTISLQLVGGVVVGVVDNGPFAGQAAFAIAINSTTGVVSVEQYLSLDHPVNPNPNDPLGLGDDTVGVTVTATDGDGDPVTSDAVDISDNITFLDDGPTVDPTLNAEVTVTVDESLPSDTPAINTGAIVKGNDPDLAGGLALGQANSGSAIVDANAVFGADGPAVSNSLTYALSILNATSGMTLTDGTPIDLVMVNGVIVGVVDGGTFNGQAAFAIAINSATGVVSVEQYLSLDHPVNPNPNDPLSFGESIVGVTVTATDGDGDPVTSDAVDIGGQLTFLDDGPVANNDTDSILGGAGPATGNVITGVEVAVAEDANGTDGVADVSGADGFGRITFIDHSNVAPGAVVPNGGSVAIAGDYGTLTIYSNGDYSYLRTDLGAAGVSDVFTYTLTDGDGDTTTATLTIGIADNFPTLPDPDQIHLDDDVIPGANGNVPDGPNDDNPDVVGQNVVNGQLNGSGGDGPLTYNFTGGVTDTLPAGFSIGAGSDSDTLLINQGATLVMTIQLNQATGAFTVTQNNPILHPTQNGTGSDDTENNLDFSIGVEVEDADGDVEPAHININVDDDTPTINVTQTNESGVVLTTQDAETDGNPTAEDTDVSAINFGGVFGLTQSAGADGTASPAVLAYDLNVVAQNSGLTSHGSVINLFEVGGVIYGTTAGVAPVDATTPGVVFSLAVSGTGVVTLTQYQQVDHAVEGVTTSPFDDQFATLVNGKITLTASSTLTDRDGDTVTDQEVVDLGGNIRFADDGPSATIVETGQGVSVDESVGIQVDSNDTTNAGVIALFAGVANTGTDTHLPQYAQNASAVVASTGSAYGADGAGSTVFSLNVSAAGVDSGLDTTSGQSILLFKEGDLIVGRVSGGPDDGKAALAIAIDPVTGVISTVEYLSINHPNAANPDDSVSIADGAVLATVTVTDYDGDTAAQSTAIGNRISFQDSAPVMTAAQNMNIQNSGDVAHTAQFAFNLGADGANTSNDVITNVTGSATVGGVPVTNWVLTANVDAGGNPSPETATTASYRFSFDYSIGGGNTATATGTLVFNKVAGTYTIDFANPIQGVTTILQTATGTLFQGYEFGTSNVDGSQPEISVTQIQDLAGTANDIYVQFTSVSEPSSGTGNDALEVTNWVPGADNPPPIDAPPNPDASDFSWSAGQVFNQADGWVSTSNDANGVDGDTIQGGEVLDFSLVQGANPTGVLAAPGTYAQASSMFLKFDGIGTGEDMIVILKLYDTVAQTYTTKAIMIQNSDIQKGPGSGPGIYSGITLDQNDGLVIIEPNDYQQGNTNLVIVGAQIAGSDEGVTGTAIDLNYGGVLGVASTGTQAFSTDTNDGPFKISSIGFTTVQTTPQNAQLDFNVTVTDGDGDSITQAIQATVTAAADSTSAATIPAANTTINSSLPPEPAGSDGSSTSNLAFSNDNGPANGNANGHDKNLSLSNFGNTGIIAGIVAAAGLSSSAAAAGPSISDYAFDAGVQDFMQTSGLQAFQQQSLDSTISSLSFGSELGELAFDIGALDGSSHGFTDFREAIGSLDAQSFGNDAPAYEPSFAVDQAPSFDVSSATMIAPSVGMPSAEALQALNLTGNVQQGGSVEQILADALGNGAAPTVDAVLDALSGSGGITDLASITNVTSPVIDHVSSWDMGMAGAFGAGNDMMFKMDVAAFHQDAVQPTVNG